MKKLLTIILMGSILLVGCSQKVDTGKENSKEDVVVNDEVKDDNSNKKENIEENTSEDKKELQKEDLPEESFEKEEPKKDSSKPVEKPVDKPTPPKEEQKPSDELPSQPPKDEIIEKPEVPQQPQEPEYTEQSYAEEVRKLINDIRVKNGLNALYSNPILTNATQERADHQLISFGHSIPDGTPNLLWFEQKGIIAGGEDLAMMSQSFSPEAIVKDWMNSPGHKVPIMADYNSYMDVAVRFSDGKVYVVACWQQ